MLLLTSVHMALFFNEAAFVSRNLLNAFFSLSFSSPSLSMRYLSKLWILKSLKLERQIFFYSPQVSDKDAFEDLGIQVA